MNSSVKRAGPVLLFAGGLLTIVGCLLPWQEVRGWDIVQLTGLDITDSRVAWGQILLGVALAAVLLGGLAFFVPNKLVQLLGRIASGGVFIFCGMAYLTPPEYWRTTSGGGLALAGSIAVLAGGFLMPAARSSAVSPEATPPMTVSRKILYAAATVPLGIALALAFWSAVTPAGMCPRVGVGACTSNGLFRAALILIPATVAVTGLVAVILASRRD